MTSTCAPLPAGELSKNQLADNGVLITSSRRSRFNEKSLFLQIRRARSRDQSTEINFKIDSAQPPLFHCFNSARPSYITPGSGPILINTSFVMYLRSVGRSAPRFIALCSRPLLVSSIVLSWYHWILRAMFYLEWVTLSTLWESYGRILPSGARKKRIHLYGELLQKLPV